ncbi:hypothetical protein ID866_8309 [Astraeus odoratus]|nr:hypothetical protein ID866_8309 [Astraeus odoratus]
MLGGICLSHCTLYRDIEKACYIPDFVSREEESYLLRKASLCYLIISESPQLKWTTLYNRRCVDVHQGDYHQSSLFFKSRRRHERCCVHHAIITAIKLLMPDVPQTTTIGLDRLRATGAFEYSPHRGPNHIILNEYHPGQGIMPHEDGPSYHPVVATISLGSHTVLHYFRYNPESEAMLESKTLLPDGGRNGWSIDPAPVLSMFLEPRSAIITTGDLYTSYLHGIDEMTSDVFTGSGTLRRGRGEEVTIANWQNIEDPDMTEIVYHGGVLPRATRYSLTCRDVEKVEKVRPRKQRLL